VKNLLLSYQPINTHYKKRVYYCGPKTEAKYEKPTQKGHYRRYNVNKNFEWRMFFCVGQAWA